MPRELSDGSDFDESDEVINFDDDTVPDLLFEQVENSTDEGFMESLERDVDARIAELEEDELRALDVPYDGEDIYDDGDSWDDDDYRTSNQVIDISEI